MRMHEHFPIPEKRGDHHISLHSGKILFQSADGSRVHGQVDLTELQVTYEELYPDGTFREALYHSLAHAYLPLPLDVEHQSMARQLRDNHIYSMHRTLDD
jgi:hypothetical protein